MRPFGLLSLLVGGLSLSAAEIVVYSDGRAIVSETRQLTVVAGEPVLWESVSPRLDLDSVLVRGGADTAVAAVSLEPAQSDTKALLAQFVGAQIEIRQPEDRLLAGRLLRVSDDRVVLLAADGGKLHVNPVGEVILPARQSLAQPFLKMRLTGHGGAQPLTVSYLTTGLAWRTSYRVVLSADGETASVSTVMTLTNQTGVDFHDVDWRFVSDERRQVNAMQPVSEHLIREHQPVVVGPKSLADGESMQLPLREGRDIPVQTFVLFAPLTGGPAGKAPAQQLLQVARITNVGPPLPGGSLLIFRDGGDGHLTYLSRQQTEAIDAGGALDIYLDHLEMLSGHRRQTVFTELPDDKAQEQTITITLRNDSPEPVTVQAQEHPWGDWQIPESSVDYLRVSDDLIVFNVDVPAKDEVTISYRLRIHY